jgi:uncharacterized phage protein (TIGR02218 family)
MSFLAQEQGIETSSPVELYEFVYDGQRYYYTSSDAPYQDPATLRNYDPLIITRGNIVFSSEANKNTLDLNVVRDAPFLNLFRVSSPSNVVLITIKRVHRTDSIDQIAVLWSGRIISVEWDTVTARLKCESIRTSSQRYGLRRNFQIQCPHVLYGSGCGVSRATYEVISNVTSIIGTTLTLSGIGSYSGNYFAGGMIQWTNNEVIAEERRLITSSSSGSIVLVSSPVGLRVNDDVRLYPGCDHSIGANGCEKFNNTDNYGGFPHTPPKKNPFGSEPLF